MGNSLGLKEAALIEYLDECTEMLERFSKNLAVVESGNASADILAAIYRDVHTMKGSSQLFGFMQVAQLAHAMETCLDPVRKGSMLASSKLVDSLYAGADIITSLLMGIRENKKEPDLREQIKILIPRLIEVTEQAFTGAIVAAKDKTPPADNIPKENEKKETAAQFSQKTELQQPMRDKSPVSQEPKKAEENPRFGFFEDAPVTTVSTTQNSALQPTTNLTSKNVVSAPKSNDAPQKTTSDDGQSETIRVHVSLLDNLMNLVGELVLIRNQLLQHAKVNDNDSEFSKMSQQLNILTAELQNEVMKTRMQPIGNVLNKFTRVVRDMGRDLSKKIELVITGSETELDKTIVEAVKDPLTHIVRNSIDHGIEAASERKAAGKADTGQICIKAHHESGQVIIEISDDGRGLDPKIIGSKAVEKGVITAETLAKMTSREAQFLIFAPGFSTAAAVSNISGRGVGMDVVKTNIERIGGMVDLTSVPGEGTTLKLKIPLTLAIVPALIVRALNQRFAIPQSKLVELVRIDETESSGEKIENLQGSPVLRLRGKILPLLTLSQVLSRPGSKVSYGEQKQNDSSINVVVLNADNFQFGLVVDAVEDTADIVVKALSSFLKELPHFSGATIMGDGSVALTIDAMGISAAVRMNAETDTTSNATTDTTKQVRSRHQIDAAEFLLVNVGAPGSYAIPLTVVSRLEEFNATDFELSGEQRVIRYRDSLLPVFSLPEYLQLPFAAQDNQSDKTPVVVIRRGDHLYGIEVKQIQDVIATSAHIDQTVRDRPGILGTMVADERVLVVVDILGMIDALKSKLTVGSEDATPGERNEETATISHTNKRKYRVLIVEDSSFFRNYMRQVLEDAGFQTEIACDGADAWNILETHDAGYFALVLSDIEMPVMDGFELATKASNDDRFKHLPLVAVTTRFSNADIERGTQVGFSRYLEKLNPEKLINALEQLLLNKTQEELKRADNF